MLLRIRALPDRDLLGGGVDSSLSEALLLDVCCDSNSILNFIKKSVIKSKQLFCFEALWMGWVGWMVIIGRR